MKQTHNFDVLAFLAALERCRDRRKFLNQPHRKTYVDTNELMSSLREMITADVRVQLAKIAGNQSEVDEAGLHYSRHETVVREQLKRLGKEASRYKEPVRYK